MGGPTPPFEPRSLKVFGFLFSGGCDATISNEGFFIRFTWTRRQHSYYSELAPTVSWIGVFSLRWFG